jgi:hypothetical protein
MTRPNPARGCVKTPEKHFCSLEKGFKLPSLTIKMRHKRNMSDGFRAAFVREEFSHGLALQRTRHNAVVSNHCVSRAGSLSLGR